MGDFPIALQVEQHPLNYTLVVHISLRGCPCLQESDDIWRGSTLPTAYSHSERALALDCLYCQVCGEVYYRGYCTAINHCLYVSADTVPGARGDLQYSYINFNEVALEGPSQREVWERQ